MFDLSFVRRGVFVALLAPALALALAAACGDGGGEQTPPAGQTPAGGETPAGGTTAEIKMVPGTAFDRAQLTIPAATDVTITADNTDGTHNFSVYTADPDEGGQLINGTETCSAPCTRTVTVNLAAGEYFFRCEVHPGVMTGSLLAQ